MSTLARPTGSARPTAPTGQVDPRGQRFAATVTAVVLVAALVASPSTLSTVLVAAQLVVFATGSLLGPARTPYSLVFRTLVRPRLGAPRELEDARPPRFAQTVGLGFAAVSLVGFLAGAPAVGAVAAGLALAAAFLNAAFGYCLGCELYLIGKRVAARPT
jgi:hypothetical protein